MVPAGLRNADAAAGRAPDGASAVVVSTRELPGRDKFEAWRDFVMRLIEVEVESSAPRAFHGEMVIRMAGPAKITRSTVADTRYERTPVLAENGQDLCTLTICESGYGVGSPEAGWSGIDRGSGFFLAHDRPFTITAEGAASCAVIVVERRALADLLPRGADLGLTRVVAGDPVFELIKGYMPVLTDRGGSASPHAVEVMGQHVVDLIALLLRPSRDGLELIEGRGLKAARTQAVLDLIRRLHARPGLSADRVGRDLGISARQVHRLLEETPKTFYEHVLEQRLRRAHELLSRPGGAALPIAEIARRCGFVSVSHFGRSFATRFGMTPSAVRAKALH